MNEFSLLNNKEKFFSEILHFPAVYYSLPAYVAGVPTPHLDSCLSSRTAPKFMKDDESAWSYILKRSVRRTQNRSIQVKKKGTQKRWKMSNFTARDIWKCELVEKNYVESICIMNLLLLVLKMFQHHIFKIWSKRYFEKIWFKIYDQTLVKSLDNIILAR